MSTLTISNEVFDPSHLLEANEPITPPPSLSQLHSFLSFSPSPTPPRRTYPLPSRLNLQPPIQLLSPTLASPESNFNDLNNKEYDELSSPTFSLLSSTLSTRGGGGGFSSRNPFLAILIAQQAEGEGIESALSASQDTVPSSALPEVSSQEGDISQTTGSRLESPISREEKEEEETEHRIVFSEGADGESFSDVLQEIASDCDGSSSKDWEEEMDGEELAFSHPFASEIRESSKVIEVQSEEQPSTPVTPILSITPSSPDQTPRAKLSSSPSKRRSVSSPRSRRQSVITASSPRRYRVSPRRSSTATAAVTTATSRRSSIAPQSSSLIQGFNYYPTSPLHSLQHSPTIPSSRTPSFSPKKKKSQPSSSKSRSRTSSRPPPSRLRPVEAFDAEALDLFFGVTKSVSKARRGGYETAAREAGVLSGKVGIGEEEKEREQWRKVEEFRGLLDQAATQESEDEIEEEEVEEGEVLHIKASPYPSISEEEEITTSSTSTLSLEQFLHLVFLLHILPLVRY
ncbi:hypothetical protein JCM3765_007184 [Sporobolomyces pararoseus]